MTKFHIKESGDPGPCSASVRDCPRGGENDHFATREEAHAAYEKRNGGSFATATLTKPKNAFALPTRPPREPMGDPFDLDSEWNNSAAEDAYAAQAELREIASSPAMRQMVPRDGQYEKYYEDTDKKHFLDKESAGSKFTNDSLKSLEDVTALALQQRGNLEGDDRERLIAMGGNPAAFGDNFRYLMVQTEGKLGAAPLDAFPPGTKFHAIRTKTGGKVSLVAEVDDQPQVSYGVVVIGTPPGAEHEQIITAHPGMPSKSSGNDTFASVEGKTLTADEVKSVAGTDRVNVNTKLREKPSPERAAQNYYQADRIEKEAFLKYQQARGAQAGMAQVVYKRAQEARIAAERLHIELNPSASVYDDDDWGMG